MYSGNDRCSKCDVTPRATPAQLQLSSLLDWATWNFAALGWDWTWTSSDREAVKQFGNVRVWVNLVVFNVHLSSVDVFSAQNTPESFSHLYGCTLHMKCSTIQCRTPPTIAFIGRSECIIVHTHIFGHCWPVLNIRFCASSTVHSAHTHGLTAHTHTRKKEHGKMQVSCYTYDHRLRLCMCFDEETKKNAAEDSCRSPLINQSTVIVANFFSFHAPMTITCRCKGLRISTMHGIHIKPVLSMSRGFRLWWFGTKTKTQIIHSSRARVSRRCVRCVSVAIFGFNFGFCCVNMGASMTVIQRGKSHAYISFQNKQTKCDIATAYGYDRTRGTLHFRKSIKY